MLANKMEQLTNYELIETVINLDCQIAHTKSELSQEQQKFEIAMRAITSVENTLLFTLGNVDLSHAQKDGIIKFALREIGQARNHISSFEIPF